MCKQTTTETCALVCGWQQSGISYTVIVRVLSPGSPEWRKGESLENLIMWAASQVERAYLHATSQVERTYLHAISQVERAHLDATTQVERTYLHVGEREVIRINFSATFWLSHTSIYHLNCVLEYLDIEVLQLRTFSTTNLSETGKLFRYPGETTTKFQTCTIFQFENL